MLSKTAILILTAGALSVGSMACSVDTKSTDPGQAGAQAAGGAQAGGSNDTQAGGPAAQGGSPAAQGGAPAAQGGANQGPYGGDPGGSSTVAGSGGADVDPGLLNCKLYSKPCSDCLLDKCGDQLGMCASEVCSNDVMTYSLCLCASDSKTPAAQCASELSAKGAEQKAAAGCVATTCASDCIP